LKTIEQNCISDAKILTEFGGAEPKPGGGGPRGKPGGGTPGGGGIGGGAALPYVGGAAVRT